MIKAMKISRQQVNTRKRSMYRMDFIQRYVRLVLWLLGPVSLEQDFLKLGERIRSTKKCSGTKYCVLYLKECLRLVQFWKAGNPTTCLLDGPRVASRRGLPLIIPGSVRLLMESGCSSTIRIVLTIISIFRVWTYSSRPKLETITAPFKGRSTMLNPATVEIVWKLFKPFVGIPSIGQINLLPLRTAGPNAKRSILGAPLDAYAWHNAPQALRDAFTVVSDYFASGLSDELSLEIEAVKDLTPVKGRPRLGKLSLKDEPAGKVRVFAIVDVWTQSVLKPLHEYIYSVLREIPQDGTFNQAAPLNRLRGMIDSNTKVFSFDLSAATDRLPIDMQVQVLAKLCCAELALAWKCLLIERDYWLAEQMSSDSTDVELVPYRYSVGQPMGALSSFGMLALSHHFLVQLAAYQAGYRQWFDKYALLGDDIVIADEAVAKLYHALMVSYLGLDINMSKTLVSNIGVMEFAKRLVSPTEEFTPLGAKNLSGVLKQPAQLPNLLTDLISKGDEGNWTEERVKDKIATLDSEVIRLAKGTKEALLWSIIGPFGFIGTSGISPTEDETSLLDFKGTTLLRSLEEACLYKYSLEWESAWDKTLANALALWKREVYPDFEGSPSPHTFPSYRQLAISALEAIDRVFEKRTKPDMMKELGVYNFRPLDSYWAVLAGLGQRFAGQTANSVFKKVLASMPTVSPFDDPWTKPKEVQPTIRRLGVDFFKRIRSTANLMWTGPQ